MMGLCVVRRRNMKAKPEMTVSSTRRQCPHGQGSIPGELRLPNLLQDGTFINGIHFPSWRVDIEMMIGHCFGLRRDARNDNNPPTTRPVDDIGEQSALYPVVDGDKSLNSHIGAFESNIYR